IAGAVDPDRGIDVELEEADLASSQLTEQLAVRHVHEPCRVADEPEKIAPADAATVDGLSRGARVVSGTPGPVGLPDVAVVADAGDPDRRVRVDLGKTKLTDRALQADLVVGHVDEARALASDHVD